MTPTNVFLHCEISHDTEPHTSENILKELNIVERELEQMGVEVIGLITDNEPKMVKVREDFEE